MKRLFLSNFVLTLVCVGVVSAQSAFPSRDPWLSKGRKADPQSKILSEIREAELRKVPLEVAVKARNEYSRNDAIPITIVVTNLFDKPILLNTRMLVNHALLPGEVAFRIIGPDGKKCEIQRLVTPISVGPDDFVILPRGMSVQRTIDLANFYPLTKRGTYTVEAIYHNEMDAMQASYHAWRGQAKAEPVEITLK